MYTENVRPGKFEGNASQLLAEAAYNASLDGASETLGDLETYGIHHTLVLGRRYGFVVTENDHGFVVVEPYPSHEAARAAWEGLEREFAAEDEPCPYCGSQEKRWLGNLGAALYAGCRGCGLTFKLEQAA
jgi:hypothetical protein